MKILVPGNHDGFLSQCASGELKEVLEYAIGDKEFYTLLSDSGCEYQGLKFYGSPWTPEFCNWHFMKRRGPDIKKVWDIIPDDTDILITHGPPFGILDKADNSLKVGCEDLAARVKEVKPKIHIFGHVHENGRSFIEIDGTLFINVAYLTEKYKPTYNFMRVTIQEGKAAVQTVEIPKD
jgi:predicted phosphodiesterase